MKSKHFLAPGVIEVGRRPRRTAAAVALVFSIAAAAILAAIFLIH